jgi:hypothetical protein
MNVHTAIGEIVRAHVSKVNLFAQRVRKYAISTGDEGLDELVTSCESFGEMVGGLEYVIGNDEIQECVVKLVNVVQSQMHSLREWNCLSHLVSAKFKNIIAMFAESAACHPMLVYCGTEISNSRNDEEMRCCFTFVNSLMGFNDVWLQTAYDIAALREAIFRYLSGHFDEASCATQRQALKTFANFVRLFSSGWRKDEPVVLLRDGALRAIMRAALHVFSLPATETYTEMRLCAATRALLSTLRTARTIPAEQLSTLSDDMYKLNRNDAFRINAGFHDFLSYQARNDLHFMLVVVYGDYVLDVLGSEALRSFVLFKSPRSADAKPIALLLAEYCIASRDVRMEHGVMASLRRFAIAVPEVTAVLSALPPLPKRAEKNRYCAYPYCGMVGTGLHTNLRKCSRCMAVYYCSKDHQQQHWSAHKLYCVKATPVADEAQGAEG